MLVGVLCQCQFMDFDVFVIANVIGSCAFALSGFLVGARKHLDYMGVFIVSILTANGGGAIRDVLVGRVPSVLSDEYAFLLVCGVIVGALILRLHTRVDMHRRVWFVISDAVGLVAFSVTGALVAIEVGLPLFGGMALAFITATGGGIIRDVLVNDMPSLLKSDFYGTVSLLVAMALYFLSASALWSPYSIGLVFLVALILRLAAYRYGWRLPKITAES